MSPRTVDVDRKKLLIIGNAFNVFRENGYANTKMSDIAEAAGISKGTIYLYFKSKEELLAKALETMLHLIQEKAYGQLEAIQDSEERLREFIHVFMGVFQEVAGVIGLLMEAISSDRLKVGDMEERSYLAGAYRNAINRVEAMLREGARRGVFREIDFHTSAIILVCMIDGLQIPYAISSDLVDIEKAAKVVEEMVFRFVK
ncbi:MAG: TetR/AcrR family transcriptional regulator [Actinobacteria bacterium]|jgi:AcrR family transcriptional regulator|nr:MAG: TetR/AcrR family transcriptional regulator [Actinomycetota bacterium]